jgi:arylsulfatase A-like enzyme
MSSRWFCLAFIGLVVASGAAAQANEPKKFNVLFIAIDDLNDWVGYLKGHPNTITPNLDKLAARSAVMKRSYCASPCCNPSRAALMSGLRPGASGVYGNSTDWRQRIGDVPTIPLHFRAHGYWAGGSGKIYHGGFDRPSDWDDYLKHEGGGGPNSKPAAGAPDGVGGIKFAPLPQATDADISDHGIVDYAIEQLGRTHDKPFFLACGLHKPHMPWNVPQKYYDMHPLSSIQMPPYLETDLDDVPPGGIAMAKPDGDHAAMVKSGRWKEAVQAYLATISYCDAEIGRLIDAFDRSAHRDNTILVLWSDHGWHLGEKNHWRKFALWERATKAPMLWNVPGMTRPGQVVDRPVDFMSIYPTLCDLAGIPTPKHVQGASIRPLLENPSAEWKIPAVTTWLFNNHTVRNDQFRYIRYNDGGEELYDHGNDPNEWTNVAGQPQYAAVKAELARWLPTQNQPDPETRAKPAGEKKKNKKKNQ